jgi:hypothetical protein
MKEMKYMTDIHSKKVIKEENGVNPIVAGIAGVIAGGAAVAAAVALSNKDNQKKMSDAFDGAKEKVTDYIDAVKSQPVVEKGSVKVEKAVNDVKKVLDKKV